MQFEIAISRMSPSSFCTTHNVSFGACHWTSNLLSDDSWVQNTDDQLAESAANPESDKFYKLLFCLALVAFLATLASLIFISCASQVRQIHHERVNISVIQFFDYSDRKPRLSVAKKAPQQFDHG